MWCLFWLLCTTYGGFYIGSETVPTTPNMEWIGAGVGFVVGLLLWLMFKAASGESVGDAFGGIGDSFGGGDGGDGGDGGGGGD
jgi:hypothetical protein